MSGFEGEIESWAHRRVLAWASRPDSTRDSVRWRQSSGGRLTRCRQRDYKSVRFRDCLTPWRTLPRGAARTIAPHVDSRAEPKADDETADSCSAADGRLDHWKG